jgi:HK97 family phage major capsid protein
MELKELLRKRATLVTQAREIEDKATKESRAKTAEERTAFESLIVQAEAMREDIDQRQRLDALAGIIATAGGEGAEHRGITLPHQEPRNLGKYSLLRAILTMANRGKLDGLEGEVSQELIQRRGNVTKRSVPANGFVMPYDLPIDLRSAAVGRSRYASENRSFGVTAGAGGIPTIVDTTYIEVLRNRMVTRQAGARVMTDMVGNFSIPRQSATTTMYWLAEGGSPTGTQPTVDQVPFTPRTAGAYTDITRRLAEQINTDAEMFVREDLAAVVARGVDLAGLNGTGNNNQPLGIMQNPSVPIISLGTNGAAPTWAAAVDLETQVAKQNADEGALAYMTNAVGRGTLKQTTKVASSTFPIYIWEDGEVNGYPAYVTNQLPSNLAKGSGTSLSPLLYGNWSDLVYAFWSGQDVIVDPYTGSSSGTLRIVTLQDVDVNIRHYQSFAMVLDMITL